jgi:hypothetical protein
MEPILREMTCDGQHYSAENAGAPQRSRDDGTIVSSALRSLHQELARLVEEKEAEIRALP